ncbi:uncharacterized protein LACBIDRAFT_332258 [Laccaria bicolor S238N-H82]|uniref:Predicted protein n=1 Tax=Laccaria bicolor (strain S238N-H82 / ATCC MYA-4686) TaxID=486041 RepID=B0DS43_LACBS|nr:uncharacterized protein LACBIDRAFT_332258 [Laccaria bicolor S238N-H82]EDR02726.1 predicted protein [Laccaria bicolor S238N-H82]|eukprot:XP_001886770.1 predicted protein [Laccaria bicolor S238N-H82]
MTSFADFPPEIVKEIIDVLQHNLLSLKACSQTCQSLLPFCRNDTSEGNQQIGLPAPSFRPMLEHKPDTEQSERHILTSVAQLEQTVTKLQTELGYTPEQISALPLHTVKIRELEADLLRAREENEELWRLLAESRVSTAVTRRDPLTMYPDGRRCDRDYKRRKMQYSLQRQSPRSWAKLIIQPACTRIPNAKYTIGFECYFKSPILACSNASTHTPPHGPASTATQLHTLELRATPSKLMSWYICQGGGQPQLYCIYSWETAIPLYSTPIRMAILTTTLWIGTRTWMATITQIASFVLCSRSGL